MQFRRLVLILMAALSIQDAPALAGATSSAQVGVTIHVEPIARVGFPEGTEFSLVVPPPACLESHAHDRHGCSHWWQQWRPPVLPVRIPFVVTGNAVAMVSARPDQYLRVAGGPWLGKATRQGHKTLGYQLIVQFPVPDRFYRWRSIWPDWQEWANWILPAAWPGFGPLPHSTQMAELGGGSGAGTPPLTADVAAFRGSAYGVIYATASRRWTENGKPAVPGRYFGSIEVTVTAAQP